MRIKKAQLLLAVNALWLSLIFTLYLAPTKYYAADLLASALLVITLATLGLWRSGLTESIKPLAPLLVLLIYVVTSDVFRGGSGNVFYARELLIGFVPFLLLYVLFRNQNASQYQILIVLIFVLPGLIHLAYMCLDMFLAIRHGEVAFMTSSKQGFLEYIKETPRVGRRYLSIALLHLLFGGILMVKLIRHPLAKYWAWGLVALSVVSLALMDARAAYVSLAIGGLLLSGAVGIKRTRIALKAILQGTVWWKMALVGLVVTAVALGYSAGKSRWVSMTYSFNAAVYDVFDRTSGLGSRPYVDQSYWSAPIDDVNKCYLEEHFRCKVDQSAYLRVAWLLEGLQSLIEHPLGIGYSDDYMGRIWGVAGDESKYQRSDSFLLELVVSFGMLGILLFACLWWEVARTLRRAVQAEHAIGASMMVVAGIIFVCVGRSLVDVFSEGLWRYLMALLGIYYGLLHSGMVRTRG